MALIKTTLGDVDESALARTVGFEERPDEFVIWVEWKYQGELVKRDAHVVLKPERMSVETQSVVNALA